jgi:hypothetical protein
MKSHHKVTVKAFEDIMERIVLTYQTRDSKTIRHNKNGLISDLFIAKVKNHLLKP